MRRNALGVLLVALAVVGAVAPPAAAEPPVPLDLGALGLPTFTTFSVRDGLPESAVTGIAVDAEGFAWASSVEGLSRYDGHRWKPQGLPGGVPGRVNYFHLDHAGTLWVALQGGGLARLERGRWSVESAATGLATDLFFRVLELPGREGPELWALSADAGLFVRVGARWQPDPGNAQLPPGRSHGLARTREIGGGERLWAATFNDGLWTRPAGGAWRRFSTPGLDAAQIDDIVVTRHRGAEELWIATYGGGLYRLTVAGLERVAPAFDGPDTQIVYNLQASQPPSGVRTVWASTRGGVMRIRGDETVVFDRRHGLPSNAARSVLLWTSPDGIEVLWVATEGGLARAVLGGSPWRTAALLGARSNGVFGVRVEPDRRGGERLWVASSGEGLSVFERGRWRSFGPGDGLPGRNARLVVRVPEATGAAPTLFASVSPGELLRVHEGPRFERLPTPWPKDDGQHVMDLVARTTGGQHELWAATWQSGLYRLRGGTWTAFRAPTAVEPWRVVKLVEQVDGQGRSWLWASTNQGLARFDGHDWTLLGREHGLPELDLLGLSLIEDRGGRPVLWAGSYRGGVLRVDVSDPARPRALPASDLPPPPVTTVYTATADSRGRVYLCTDAGVQLLTPTADGGFADRVFGRRDGLVHEECNTNAQLVDAHGRYWAGTLAGLSVYEPDLAVADTRPKPLRLMRVSADGRELEARGLSVSSRTRELRFEAALLSWQREAESRFRWQLVGYDPEPGPWRAENSRVYGALPPGGYVLRIEARDYAGLASAPIEVPVEVVATWWQRLSVRLGMLAVVALAIAGLLRRRQRLLLAEKAALERAVAERTTDLAAANERLAQLSRQDPLTGVGNRRRFDEGLDEEWRRATRQRTPLGLLLLDVDCFKAYNDALGHLAGDECLRRVAAEVAAAQTRAGELVARYGGEEFAVLMPGASREGAMAAARNVRQRVAALALPHPRSTAAAWVTVSVGVGWAQPERGGFPADLVARADDGLYRAKQAGRDRECEGSPATGIAGQAPALGDDAFLAAFEAGTLAALGIATTCGWRG
jgi:diguanylate cyclase (GGDEF)-like protein